MLNDINLQNSWDSGRCKYQLKQITKTREKNVETNENCILTKMVSNFKTLASTFYAKKHSGTSKLGWLRADYMEWAAEVKRQPARWDSLEKW